MTEPQTIALSILKADKEKRKGFSSYPKIRLKRETGITDNELFELLDQGLIKRSNGINDTVITYLG